MKESQHLEGGNSTGNSMRAGTLTSYILGIQLANWITVDTQKWKGIAAEGGCQKGERNIVDQKNCGQNWDDEPNFCLLTNKWYVIHPL